MPISIGRSVMSTPLYKHPLALLLIAHSIFSIGIWNDRNGYGEQAEGIKAAIRVLHSNQLDLSLYNDITALILKYASSDPVIAVILLNYLSSLLATVALFLVLKEFSLALRESAIVLACVVWIASSFDAPYIQNTSLSLFTLAVMLLGVFCVTRKQSIGGWLGFYLFGIIAALMRPEYFLTILLMTFVACGAVIRSACAGRNSYSYLTPSRVITGTVLLFTVPVAFLIIHPPDGIKKEMAHLNKYALFGLGQCYAEYYHRSHPQRAFSPMTEYREVLDETFGTLWRRSKTIQARRPDTLPPTEPLIFFCSFRGRSLDIIASERGGTGAGSIGLCAGFSPSARFLGSGGSCAPGGLGGNLELGLRGVWQLPARTFGNC
jgi:hypothetical protein